MASSLVCDRIPIAGAAFKRGSLLNPIKTFSVLDKKTQSNDHRHDRRTSVATWTSSSATNPNQACRQTGRAGPLCPLALWYVCGTRRRVRRWQPAEMPGGLRRLWEMSRQCASAHCRPGGACLLGNRSERDGGLTTDWVCALRDSLSKGCTRCWLTLVC